MTLLHNYMCVVCHQQFSSSPEPLVVVERRANPFVCCSLRMHTLSNALHDEQRWTTFSRCGGELKPPCPERSCPESVASSIPIAHCHSTYTLKRSILHIIQILYKTGIIDQLTDTHTPLPAFCQVIQLVDTSFATSLSQMTLPIHILTLTLFHHETICQIGIVGISAISLHIIQILAASVFLEKLCVSFWERARGIRNVVKEV
mmetsp:Transcript_2524/g.9532  ORF Transcript_2524/g.9532 Transcript_2524/m.9532 type:complete len:203 (+) Transcript_2524:89-697(+)